MQTPISRNLTLRKELQLIPIKTSIIQPYISKEVNRVGRFALILEGIYYNYGDSNFNEVSEVAIKCAIDLTNYYRLHFLKVLNEVITPKNSINNEARKHFAQNMIDEGYSVRQTGIIVERAPSWVSENTKNKSKVYRRDIPERKMNTEQRTFVNN